MITKSKIIAHLDIIIKIAICNICSKMGTYWVIDKAVHFVIFNMHFLKIFLLILPDWKRNFQFITKFFKRNWTHGNPRSGLTQSKISTIIYLCVICGLIYRVFHGKHCKVIWLWEKEGKIFLILYCTFFQENICPFTFLW